MKSYRFILVVSLLLTCLLEGGQVGASLLSKQDYSYGYWLNGMRKAKADASRDILCFETGHYGFSLDLANFTAAKFGTFDHGLSYSAALEGGAERMKLLPDAELEIELESKGTVFRVVSSKTATSNEARSQVYTRMWESGRLVQRYDLLDLNFESRHGSALGTRSKLDVVAWPESLTLTATIAPSLLYADGWTEGRVEKGLCVVNKAWEIPADSRLESETMTVEFWVKIPKEIESGRWGYLLSKNKHEGFPGFYSFIYQNGTVSVNMNFGAGVGLRGIRPKGHSFKRDEWNHLALTYDGKEMCYYINGQSVGTETVGSDRPISNEAMYLGHRPGGSVPVISSLYDQVRVWNRALPPEEIMAHATTPEKLELFEGLRFSENFDSYVDSTIPKPVWTDVTMRVRLKTASGTWEESRRIDGEWPLWEAKSLTLTCDITQRSVEEDGVSFQVASANATPHPVSFNPLYNAHGVEVRRVARSWNAKDPKKSGYDEYSITVNNSGDAAQVSPLYFDIYDVAGVTGVTAMLCDSEGRPSGIPVQLSKNWHDMSIGQYVRCFASVPVEPGTSEYRLRIAYGFYGALPAASHAQLSLIGWGNHGRWDQLAIGSWGETICFDTDMSCVDVAITDVRMLMARNGADGASWNWTDAGWGGDWLGVFDSQDRKIATTEMKACYLSQGPCLTDVRFNGHYGEGRDVAVRVDTSTLRTDDFARTFFKIRYNFDQSLSAEKAWLFKIGRTGNSISPRLAYGNQDGLLKELAVPTTLKKGEFLLNRHELEGAAPWWVGFPGGYLTGGREWGTGSRGLIVRSYKASFGGVVYSRPTLTTPVLKTDPNAGINLDLLLTAPQGVIEFKAGDHVEMELELITFPRNADDYYGMNETFRAHLVENPSSWKTIYLEAIGNNLQVEVSGGELRKAYPVLIDVSAGQVEFQISGGVGAVPVSLSGVPSAEGNKLFQKINGQWSEFDQSVHGNDFWQCVYQPSSDSYQITYNLPSNPAQLCEWRFVCQQSI